MMEEELIKIWKSSSNEERVKFEKSRLILEVQSNLDHFHKMVKYRDWTEISLALAVIPIFAYQVYAIPFLLSKVASALIVIWLVYVIFRYRNSRKHKPGSFTETYRDYLMESKKYLQVQKRMSDTVLYWYILPCQLAVLLFIAGAYMEDALGTRIFALMVSGVIVLSVGIQLWTQWGVKKYIVPKLKKTDQLLQVLEE